MNLFHLISVSFLMLNFSGQPAPVKDDLPVAAKTVIISAKNNNELIPWTPYEKLTWDDFLCEPLRGTDAVASTSTSLGIAYQMKNGRLAYQITCNFSKTKSWGLIKTDYILAHEQGHFDITEIFARKLNEALQNYQFNRRTFKPDINNIYQSIVSQKEEYQKMYDDETNHSRNRKMQYEWFDKIQQMLDETAPFAQYP